jgi:hypothetical protein
MKTFLPIVIERPDKSLKINEILCPKCKGSNIKIKDTSSTLVGGRKEDDVNHVINNCTCRQCKFNFQQQHRHNNVWYTDKNKILLGIPSCFESYIYTCKDCGGDVWRNYRGKNDEEVFTLISYADGTKNYKIIFECTLCGRSIESDIEYWFKGWQKHKLGWNVAPKALKPGWTFSEKEDIIVTYDVGIIKQLKETLK